VSDEQARTGEKGEKVEEVNLDELDEPAHAAPVQNAPADAGAVAGIAPASDAPGSTRVEVVSAEELAAHVEVPEYTETPWLLLFPLAVALVLAWNVDWRERRVRAETTARRAKKAPPQRKAAKGTA
jgi:hypothetical protein